MEETEKMKYTDLVNITLKNLESKSSTTKSAVVKYERIINKAINKTLNDQKFLEKLAESLALGLPLHIDKNLKITVVRP